MPQVSIIIINYNTFHLTCEAIASVYEKTLGVSYEIILVDNASTECDPVKFKELFPEIILVKNPENSGFAKGNNLGISYAAGDTILLLNSDAALLNDAISIAYNRLISDPGLGVVSGKLVYPDGKIQPQCGRFPSVKLQLIELFRLQKLISEKKKGELLLGTFFNHEYIIKPDWVWGTFFLIKKEVICKLPGNKLPDDFFMYSEDLLWCYKIRKLGYEILYDPAALILHHFSQSTKKNKAISQNLMILKNEDLFFKKNYGFLHTEILYFFKAINFFILSFKDPHYKSLYRIYIKLFLNKELK